MEMKRRHQNRGRGRQIGPVGILVMADVNLRLRDSGHQAESRHFEHNQAGHAGQHQAGAQDGQQGDHQAETDHDINVLGCGHLKDIADDFGGAGDIGHQQAVKDQHVG